MNTPAEKLHARLADRPKVPIDPRDIGAPHLELAIADASATPVAWMYDNGTENYFFQRERQDAPLNAKAGWTETPLYSCRSPAQQDEPSTPVARQADPAPGWCPHCRKYSIAEPIPAAVAQQEDKLKRLYEAADILLIELDAAPHDSRDASDCDICRATDKFRQTFYTMADITVSTPSAPAAVAREPDKLRPADYVLGAREPQTEPAQPADKRDAEQEKRAGAAFTEYFVKNYPSDTIIGRPEWHAPKIFRAALYALDAALSARQRDKE